MDARRLRGTRAPRGRDAARGGRRRAASAPRSAGGRHRRATRRPTRARRSRGPCRPAAPVRARAARPRRSRPPRSRRRRPRRLRSRRRRRDELAPLRTASDDYGLPPASATHAESISPIGPAPRIATRSPARPRLARRRAGSTRVARPSPQPRPRAGWDGEEVDARDPLRHEDVLGVSAVQQLQTLAALVARAAAELAATTRLPVATSTPQNSCPNGLGSSPSRTGCPRRKSSGRCRRSERPRPGRARRRDRFRLRYLLEAEIPRPVEPQRPHGVKTTLSARPER